MKRLALGALIALSLAACGGSAGSSTVPSAGPATTGSPVTAGSPGTISVTLSDFKITPSPITSGTAVSIAVVSDGPTPHNLTIRDASDAVVAASADLSTGESDTVEAELAPGEYETFCSLPGHESLGMRGTLTVAAQ